MTALAVAIGGALGAAMRYLIDVLVQERNRGPFPRGTLVVNVMGTFVLGLVLGLAEAGSLGSGAVALLGSGVCGALTTYSTFSVDTVRLLEEHRIPTAARYVGLSLALGMIAAVAGWSLALLLT
ncbi:fluoride efflux transporter CrcB [Demetria terragena]|uniref:fluoride efflux transporter CrcB n=1 Tax=Demetria terragena TaxID=63959 RepID=UPI00036601DF|nr:fluoride efflux transporter CrcB [Demetria terragena]